MRPQNHNLLIEFLGNSESLSTPLSTEDVGLESTPGADLAGNGISVDSGLAKELDALGSDAEQGDQDYRLDLLTFVSFDLVGSTTL